VLYRPTRQDEDASADRRFRSRGPAADESSAWRESHRRQDRCLAPKRGVTVSPKNFNDFTKVRSRLHVAILWREIARHSTPRFRVAQCLEYARVSVTSVLEAEDLKDLIGRCDWRSSAQHGNLEDAAKACVPRYRSGSRLRRRRARSAANCGFVRSPRNRLDVSAAALRRLGRFLGVPLFEPRVRSAGMSRSVSALAGTTATLVYLGKGGAEHSQFPTGVSERVRTVRLHLPSTTITIGDDFEGPARMEERRNHRTETKKF